MIDLEQQRLAEIVKVLLQTIREKERTGTKPRTPKATLPSLFEELIQKYSNKQ